jgi:hypothetical protein
MYHPSHRVPDLDEAEEFFLRVFGRQSVRLSTLSTPGRAMPDYSTFTLIADVLFDCIDPRRYVVAGEQRYPGVDRPTLEGMGWYVEGLGSLYRSLRTQGFTVVDQLDRPAEGDDPPTAAGTQMPLCFTTAQDAGLRHELLPPIPFPLDPRVQEGWALPPPSEDDPLGIVRCAHHTVLTNDLPRALRLSVEVFGGTVVDRRRDEVLGADTTSVRLADAVLRYAVPRGNSPVSDVFASNAEDSYHSITWQVLDLDRVERHLSSVGVGLTARTDDLIVTDPRTSLGIPWGFMTASSVGG